MIMAYLYTVTNKINKKVYVGKTTSSNINSYWKQHVSDALGEKQFCNRVFYKALRKYGYDGFYWKVIEEIESNYDVCRAEVDLIAKLKTNILRYGPDAGYNMTDGGEGTLGYRHTKETKIKMSNLQKGRKISEEQKKNHSIQMTGPGNGMFSKNHSEESKKSMSINSSGPKNGMFGKTHSKEARNKIKEKRSIFTMQNIADIRKLRADGVKIKDIASKYSVSKTTIRKIISYRTYNDS